MFYYLTYSNKSYYDPKYFVNSFKGIEGKPTNPNIQCDAQEFLTRFIDILNNELFSTKEKFLCSNIFGGKIRQQIICTNKECNNISEKNDSFVYLSLDIKDCKTIHDCLDKYIIKKK